MLSFRCFRLYFVHNILYSVLKLIISIYSLDNITMQWNFDLSSAQHYLFSYYHILYQTFPNEVEGQLGYRFASLVRSDCLASIAEQLELGDFIYLSPGALDASKQARKRILSNACEAIIAAIFLDGGYSEAFCFVKKHWRPLIIESTEPVKDSKTKLQEWAQSKKYPVPTYSCVDQSGPDHSPTFFIEVSFSNYISAKAEANSIKDAEKKAANSFMKINKILWEVAVFYFLGLQILVNQHY